MKGKFIVFEGIDGCGKTTQAKKLAEHLQYVGYKSWVTEEPTNLPTGQLIRRYLKDIKAIGLDEIQTDLFIQSLYAADRYLHLHHKQYGIKQKLAEGYNVICSRYVLSSFAYCDQVLKEEIMRLNDNFLLPDLTIFLDILPVDAELRLAERNKKDDYDSKINQALINYYHYLFKGAEYTTPNFEEKYIGPNISIESGGDPDKLADHILESLELNFEVDLGRQTALSYAHRQEVFSEF